jgi:hypothetical protein
MGELIVATIGFILEIFFEALLLLLILHLRSLIKFLFQFRRKKYKEGSNAVLGGFIVVAPFVMMFVYFIYFDQETPLRSH